MIYRFMDERTDYPVVKWAHFFEVSTSGYYGWKAKREEREHREAQYRRAVNEAFASGEGVYGIGRICGILRRDGNRASYRKVKRHMEEMGLRSVHRRLRQRSLTDSRRARGEEYMNLMRGLQITEPLQVVTSDISYIRTGEGYDYLCKIRDVASGLVLAECMMERMKADLVTETIRQAMVRWRLPQGIIFHSDRGSQYTSAAVMSLLKKHGVRQSFSRVGKPGDNAWSESFFANFKKERVHWQWFPTRAQAREAVFEYIEGFYNTRRVQKRLGYLSPRQWLDLWFNGSMKRTA